MEYRLYGHRAKWWLTMWKQSEVEVYYVDVE